MENYKRFKMTEESEFSYFLEYIIISFVKKLRRLEIYINEMEDILVDAMNIESLKSCLDSHADMMSSPVCNVEIFKNTLPAGIYDKYMDLTTATGLGISNLLSDTQGDSISYYNFRKIIDKSKFKEKLKPLSNTQKKMLEHSRDFRNWAAHVPQSLINAEIVAAESMNNLNKEKLIATRKKIMVPVFETHETEYLIKLYMDSYMSRKVYRTLLLKIHEDYQAISGQKASVDYLPIKTREYKIDSSIPDISLSMQRKKYKHSK
ncbi:hypothetical protein [Bacillus cereus group sp. BfR-BA-01330]|uniref:hypothetical protein n=1 Tax=Bacillus cereus group sp. BfR-BA-01330 TaxID=2920306 RepID=UPI001F5A0F82